MFEYLVAAAKRLYRALPAPPSTNYLYRKFDIDPYVLLPANPVIFDIGSKDAKAEYAWGAPPPGARVICVDIEPRPGVSLVADAHDLGAVRDATADCVVTVSTLEHVRHPDQVIREIGRILKPGGIVYVNVPFVFPYHSDPDDYYRYSYRGVEILCRDFERLDSGFNRGPASTMQHLLVHFLAILFSFNSRVVYGINVDVFSWLLFWLKYLDAVIAWYPAAYVIHSGAYFIGRKRRA
jgi:SAM-dependent methyltransferase